MEAERATGRPGKGKSPHAALPPLARALLEKFSNGQAAGDDHAATALPALKDAKDLAHTMSLPPISARHAAGAAGAMTKGGVDAQMRQRATFVVDAATLDSFMSACEISGPGVGPAPSFMATRERHGRGLEFALDAILAGTPQQPTIGPDTSRVPRLEALGIDRAALQAAGLSGEAVERAHRSLYVHTVGFTQSMREAVAAAQPGQGGQGARAAVGHALIGGFLALAGVLFRREVLPDVLALAHNNRLQEAELVDRLEKLTAAYEDNLTLQRTTAQLMAAHHEETSKVAALRTVLAEERAKLTESERERALVEFQYMSEAQHMADMEAEVVACRREARDATARQDGLQAKIVELEKSLVEANARGDGTDQRIAELEAALTLEKGLRAAAEERAADLEGTQTVVKWQQNVTHQRYQEEVSGRNDLDVQVLEARERAADLARKLQDAMAESREAREGTAVLEGELTQAKLKVEKLEWQVDQHKKGEEELGAEAILLRQQLERKRFKKRNYKEQLSHARAIAETAKIEAGSYREKLQAEQKAKNNLSAELKKAETGQVRTVEQLRNVSVALATTMRCLTANVTARRFLQKRIQQLAKLKASKDASLQKVERDLRAQREVTAQFQAKLARETEEHKKLSQQLEEAERQVAAAQAEAQKVQAKLSRKVGTEERLREELQQAHALEHTLREQIGVLEERVKEVLMDLGSKQKALSDVTRERQQLQNKCQSQQVTLQQREQQITALRSRVDNLEASVADAKRHVGSLEAAKTKLEARVTELTEKIPPLRAKLVEKEKQVEDLEDRLAEEQAQRAEVEARLNEQLQAQEAKCAELQDKLADAKKGFKSELDGRDTEVQDLKARVAHLEKEVQLRDDALGKTIREHEGRDAEMMELRALMKDAQDSVLDLQKQLSELKDERAVIDSQLAVLKDSNSELNYRLKAADGRVEGLLARREEMDRDLQNAITQEKDKLHAEHVELKKAFDVALSAEAKANKRARKDLEDTVAAQKEQLEAMQLHMLDVKLFVKQLEEALADVVKEQDGATRSNVADKVAVDEGVIGAVRSEPDVVHASDVERDQRPASSATRGPGAQQASLLAGLASGEGTQHEAAHDRLFKPSPPGSGRVRAPEMSAIMRVVGPALDNVKSEVQKLQQKMQEGTDMYVKYSNLRQQEAAELLEKRKAKLKAKARQAIAAKRMAAMELQQEGSRASQAESAARASQAEGVEGEPSAASLLSTAVSDPVEREALLEVAAEMAAEKSQAEQDPGEPADAKSPPAEEASKSP
ncbi:unnamed protein product [Pedinophyceae sp. YPF-701]|nr:unnamed protein product [Pedinophyceae sp. YPF-701]